MTRKIGILGGTFDPVHIGHLVCAEDALQSFGLDRVIFMVAGKPAFKDGTAVADAEDRYWMCCLATTDNDQFEVSKVEMSRVGTTYTIDTLREVHEQLDPTDQLYFILGADALIDVPLWKDAHQLDKYAQFIVATRPGYDLGEAHALLAKRLPQFSYEVMEIPRIDVSSSEIRRRFAQGLSNRYLIGEEVQRYVLERELYTSYA